jgi:hypothetical protein
MNTTYCTQSILHHAFVMSSGFLCEQNHILLQCEEDYPRLSIAGSQQQKVL